MNARPKGAEISFWRALQGGLVDHALRRAVRQLRRPPCQPFAELAALSSHMPPHERCHRRAQARNVPSTIMRSLALAALVGCHGTPEPGHAASSPAGADDGEVLQQQIRTTYPSLLYVEQYRRRFPDEVQDAPPFWLPGAIAPRVATPAQLTRALTSLEDQHVALAGAGAGKAETPGVLFRTSADGDMIVWRVFDPAASAAREGDRVLAVDGVVTRRWLAQTAAATFGGNRRGRAAEAATELGVATRVVHEVAGLGDTVRLRLQAGDDAPRVVALKFLPIDADRAVAMTAAINRADLAEVIADTRIGTLRIGAFAPQYDPVYLAAEEQVSQQPGATDDQAMLAGLCAVTRAFIARFEAVARRSDVVVIDVRGNLGGLARLARLEVDAITATPSPPTFDLFAGKQRGAVRLAEERRDPACGHADVARPIVVLDDASTRSAGEFLAAWLWAAGATVIGEPTVGAGGGRDVGARGIPLPRSGLHVLVSGNLTIFDPSGSFHDGDWAEAEVIARLTDRGLQPGRGAPFAIQSTGMRPDIELHTTLGDLRDGGVAGLRAAITDARITAAQTAHMPKR